MIGIPLAVSEEQRQVIGQGLVNPLIAIDALSNDVSPPLVRHFVKGNKFGEMLLSAF